MPPKYLPKEYQEQSALFDWRERNLKNIPELQMMFATLNGIRLPIGLAVKAKKQGNIRGVPDVMLLVPNKYFHGLMIEMKIKGGTLRSDQKIWGKNAKVYGYYYQVCFSADEAIQAIKHYLKSLK
jgi:hypothetical protein